MVSKLNNILNALKAIETKKRKLAHREGELREQFKALYAKANASGEQVIVDSATQQLVLVSELQHEFKGFGKEACEKMGATQQRPPAPNPADSTNPSQIEFDVDLLAPIPDSLKIKRR